jgi:hypothetical protein
MFTRGLRSAVESTRDPMFLVTVAVTDPGGQHEYPEHVKYEIRQGVKGDYARAGEFLNYWRRRALFPLTSPRRDARYR